MDLLNRIGNASQPVAPKPGHDEQIKRPQPNDRKPFHEILQGRLDRSADLKFSLHAMERMQNRNIHLSEQQVQKLKSGVDKVAEKGGRESLMFMDSSAFLVSVRNRTVITAIAAENLKENVFTNIDSAVVL